MSLYGNVRRIGSQAFQFDRIYPNRKALETASSAGDGVHIGRYVLIEYGHRYEAEIDETSGQKAKAFRWEFDPARNEMIQVEYDRWTERDEYKANREVDWDAYGMNYDSTVWQKIMSGNVEKYIMIAELNAILPKLNMNVEGGLIYSEADENHPAAEVYDAFNNKVENVAVDINKPYFDNIQDTELSYLLHFPQPIQLNVDTDSIDYNSEGFNMFYGIVKDPTSSYIHWITDNFYGTNYDHFGREVNNANQSPIEYAKTKLTALLNSRTLRMHIPAFGNVISDLYDILYGHPSYERDNNGDIIYLKNSDGTYMLDEFGLKIPQVAFFRTPHGRFMDSDQNPIAYNDTLGYYIVVDEETGAPILRDGEYIKGGDPILDGLRPYFKNYRDNYPYIMDLNYNPPVPKVYNGENILRNPINDADDGMYWSKSVPGIDKILSNNSAGLSMVLTDLFSSQNPITGEVKYWLLNDWTAEQFNKEGNKPTLLNKPEIVTYLTDTQYQVLSDLFNTKQSGASYAESVYPQYSSQRKAWLSGVKVGNNELATSTTQIPIFGADGITQLANSKIGYSFDYSYYKVLKDVNGDVLEDGHWYTDIATWVLRRVSNLPYRLALLDKFLVVNAYRYVGDPSLNTPLQNNLNNATIAKNNSSIVISGDLSNFVSFERKGVTAKWYAIDIDLGTEQVTRFTVGNYAVTQADVTESANAGLDSGHILYWVDLAAINGETKEVKIIKDDGKSATLDIIFNNIFKIIPLQLNSGISASSTENQTNTTININDVEKEITINGKLGELNTFVLASSDSTGRKWVGIDFKTNIDNIKTISCNNTALTDDNIAQARQILGAQNANGHIIYWVDAEEIYSSSHNVVFIYGNQVIQYKIHFNNLFEFTTIQKLGTVYANAQATIAQSNQDFIDITVEDHTANHKNIIISGILSNLQKYNSSDSPQQGQANYKWIGIDVGTTAYDLTLLRLNNVLLTEQDRNEIANLNLDTGHLVVWLNADALYEQPQDVTFNLGQTTLGLTFSFENYFEVTSNILTNIPQDQNQQLCAYNQQNISLNIDNHNIHVIGALDNLYSFASTNPNQGTKKWIGFDLDTGLETIKGLSWNGYVLTQDDEDEASGLGLENGHIVFWVGAEDLYNNGYTVTIADGNNANESLTLSFDFVNEITINVSTLEQVPDDDNFDVSNANQSVIDSIDYDNQTNTYSLRGELSLLTPFSRNGVEKSWVALDIMTNIKDITKISWNGVEFTTADVAYAESLGFTEGQHIIFWVDPTELSISPSSITITNHNESIDFILTSIDTSI